MKSWPWLRFPPPLHIFVPLVALTCSFVYLLFKLLLVTEWSVERIMDTQLGSAQIHAQKLAWIITSDKETREKTLVDELSTLQIYPSVRWAAVCDAEGKVLYSTRPDWVGKMLSEVASPLAVEIAKKAAAERRPVQRLNGRESAIAANPGSTGPDVPLRYVALAERDVAKVIAARYKHGQMDVLIAACTVTLCCVLLGGILYLFLKWRMRDFYRTTGLDNGGQATPRPLSGGDEFAEISHVFSTSEHLLRDIADNLEEVVWIVTSDMRPTYISPAFEKIYLRKRDDVLRETVGLPPYILKEYHPALTEALRSVLKGAASMHVEYRILRGDDVVRWIESRGFAVRDASGTLLRIVGVSRDITPQKDLQEEMVNVSELERHNLAHELHDDACQRLAAIKLRSETLTTRLSQEQSPHVRLAVELTSQIAGTSALLRNMARGLAPVEVLGDGLMLALRKLVQMQESIHEVPCFFDPDHPVMVTHEIVATHLYRIAQEFIHNAARHGKPERIDVKLEQHSDCVRLTVLNDGLPFQKPAAGHHSMGLKIIHYRASAIGACIDIRDRADGITGTVAVCTVPSDICHQGPAGHKSTATARTSSAMEDQKESGETA